MTWAVQWLGDVAAIAVAAACGLAACGKDTYTPPPAGEKTANPAVAPNAVGGAPQCAAPLTAACHLKAIEYFRDEMCKCTDRLCTDHVRHVETDWLIANVKGPSEDPAPDINAKMVDAIKAYTDCLAKVILPPE